MQIKGSGLHRILAALALFLAACSAPAETPAGGGAGAATDAEGGRIALTWSREGGFAGFCDELLVYSTGAVQAENCKAGLRSGQLEAGQREQLQAWIEALQPFEIDQTDPASADAMTLRLEFSGTGDKEPGEAEKQAILDFAAQVYSSVQ